MKEKNSNIHQTQKDKEIKDRKFQYLVMLRKWWFMVGIIDIPILILLWWLDYRIGFWIYLVILLFIGTGKADSIEKKEKELDL